MKWARFTVAWVLTAGCANQVELTNLNVGSTVTAPSSANIPANGLTRAVVSVHLAQSTGLPLPGLQVNFQSQHCTVVQPPTVTDANGFAQGYVTCSRPVREAIVTEVEFNGAVAPLSQGTTINFFSPADGQLGVQAGLPLDAQAVVHAGTAYFNTAYRGTVHFVSTDPQASLPSDYTFVATDLGYHRWSSGLTWRTTGEQVLTVVDRETGAELYSESYHVVASPPQGLRLLAQSTAPAGVPVALTVAAVDSLGNVIPTYAGTVSFFSSDALGSVPAAVTFEAADQGVKVISSGLVLRSGGQQVVSAQDDASPPLIGSTTLQVVSGKASQLIFSGIAASVVSGAPQPAVLLAADAFGNTDTSYVGSATLSTSDVRMVLPGTVTFAAGGAGAVALTNTTFVAAGITTLTAQSADPNVSSGQQVVQVSAGRASKLLPLLQQSAQAGATMSMLVEAVDASGNPDPTFTGTVGFTSNDSNALLPGDYTFVAADAGTHAFDQGVTLVQAGSRTVTATPNAGNAAAGTANCSVTAAGLAGIAVVAPATSTAGNNISVQVVSVDRYGNPVTSYQGTVLLSSSDPQSTIAGSVTLSSGDAGVATVAGGATLRTAGPQQIVATDTSALALPPGSATVAVTAGPLTQLVLSNIASTLSIGTVVTPVVAGADVYGNPAGSYAGTVTFTSSDPCATLPLSYHFGAVDAGSHSYIGDLVLNTLGTQSITVTDDEGHTAQQTGISVIHGCGPFGAAANFNPMVNNGYINQIDMAVDPNGHPWLITADNRGNWLPGGWWDNWRVFANHWTGKEWDMTYNPPGLSASFISQDDCAQNPRISLQADGSPAIVWGDFCTHNLYAAHLVNGAWQGYGGSTSVPVIAAAWGPVVRMGPQSSVPWVLWDGPSGQLGLSTFDGTQWQPVGGGTGLVPNTTGCTSYDLAVDAQQNVYVAFTSNQNGSATLQAYVTVWNGTSWTDLSGSSSGVGVSNTAGGASRAHVAIDSQSRPVLAWSDGRSGTVQVYLERYSGGAWNALAGSASGAGISNEPSQDDLLGSLTLDHEDNPIVAWFVFNQGNNTYYQIARYGNGAWTTLNNPANALVTSGGEVGAILGVDDRDLPVFNNWGWAGEQICSLY